jgi:hypothetical protein
MSAHKCPNCKATVNRAGYCTPCMAIYRKVNKWLRLLKGGHHLKTMTTPAGTVYWIDEPDPEVVEWLTGRGKMPDLDKVKDMSKLMSARSVLSA